MQLADLPKVDEFVDLVLYVLALAAEKFPQLVIKSPVYDAVLALRPGFDEAVALALLLQLKAQGKNVLVLAPKAGWVHSLNGVPLEAQASYADGQRLTKMP